MRFQIYPDECEPKIFYTAFSNFSVFQFIRINVDGASDDYPSYIFVFFRASIFVKNSPL